MLLNRVFLSTSVASMLLALAAWPCQVHAQVRGGLSLSSPGTIRAVGTSNAASRFGGYRSSGGYGGLQSPLGGSSLLRSNLQQTQSYHRSTTSLTQGTALKSQISMSTSTRFSRSTSGTGSTLSGLNSGLKPITTLKGSSTKIKGSSNKGFSLTPLSSENAPKTSALNPGDLFLATDAYLAAVGSKSEIIKDSDTPITTLVPDQPSRYKDRIAAGERYFRREEYRKAYDEFLFARDYASKAPETLLNLAHARFAMSRYSYSNAAFHLIQAIKVFPELPTTQLRPREFFASIPVCTERLILLEEYLDDKPNDPNALLLYAYFEWFTPNPNLENVQTALGKVVAFSTKKETRQAAETFWDGIVATGKASGELPIPETQPADTPSAQAQSDKE